MPQPNDVSRNVGTGNSAAFAEEVTKGERFTFGDNWRKFIAVLNEQRIVEAELSLKSMLGIETLKDKTFVDVGSGSGLFSLAARRLGAKVHSFDFDPSSVACTQELRRRYFPDDNYWTIEQGSALDESYLNSLGQFDFVYSWGVLHHTGNMWKALELVVSLVKPEGGKLFISIYNDEGSMSRVWKLIKRAYCRAPSLLKPLILYPATLWLWGPTLILDMIRLKPFQSWRTYSENRGMSPWRDVVDWVGGYPFEVANPGEIFDFYCGRYGFILCRLKAAGHGLGTNQFVFERPDQPSR